MLEPFFNLGCSCTFSGSLFLETLAAYVPEPKMVARAEFQFKNAKSNFFIRRGGSKAFFFKNVASPTPSQHLPVSALSWKCFKSLVL